MQSWELPVGYSLRGPLCLPQAPSKKLFIKKKKNSALEDPDILSFNLCVKPGLQQVFFCLKP